MIELILESYDVDSKSFNLEKLKTKQKQSVDSPQVFAEELKKIILLTYDTIDCETELKINLIKSIASTFDQSQIRPNVLSVYAQLATLVTKYNLNV